MGLFDRFLNRNEKQNQEKGVHHLPHTGGILNDGGILNWWQAGRNIDHYDSPTAIVHACVDAYAQTMASLYAEHFTYDDKDTKKRIKNSALSRCLHQPNDYQTRSDFILNLVK